MNTPDDVNEYATDQVSVFYIANSLVKHERIHDAWSADNGEISVVESALGVANAFMGFCEEHVDFDKYAVGCFPYEMEGNFGAAYHRSFGTRTVSAFDKKDPRLLGMLKALNLPLKLARHFTLVQDLGGEYLSHGSFKSLKDATDVAEERRRKLLLQLGTYFITEYEQDESGLSNAVQDYTLDGKKILQR